VNLEGFVAHDYNFSNQQSNPRFWAYNSKLLIDLTAGGWKKHNLEHCWLMKTALNGSNSHNKTRNLFWETDTADHSLLSGGIQRNW